MWFLIAIIGYVLLAVVFILDKFIVSGKSLDKPIIYAFYSSIIMLVALLAVPFIGPVKFLVGIDWLWAIISGITFGLGFWALYVAIKQGEASHIDPFNGAMVTIVTYLLSSNFLGEHLTDLQLAGIIILAFASLLLSFEKSKEHKGFHMGFIWAIVSGVFFAISLVSIKYLYNNYPFWPAFIWSRGTTGLLGIILLISPTVRNSFKKNKEEKSKVKKHNFVIVGIDKIMAIAATLFLQYATSLGSVTLVNALSGLQYVLMFVLIFLSTKFFPKLFKEYFTKREIAIEIIALVLVVIGSVFFVL